MLKYSIDGSCQGQRKTHKFVFVNDYTEEKFAEWREHLERTYGKGTFFSKAWLRAQLGSPKGLSVSNRDCSAATPPAEVPEKSPEKSNDTIDSIRSDLGDCRRCKLAATRTKIAFGEGNPSAELMFVGEGPGEQEDIQGRPFVGKAGQLLDKIIEAMGLKRSEVYIANIVKCRPPGNRVPEPDEARTCEPFLLRQIGAVRPKIIVALGGTALKWLLHDEDAKITRARGKFIDFQGTRLMPTFHPSFLLRNPDAKKEVWVDMKKVMMELGHK